MSHDRIGSVGTRNSKGLHDRCLVLRVGINLCQGVMEANDHGGRYSGRESHAEIEGFLCIVACEGEDEFPLWDIGNNSN